MTDQAVAATASRSRHETGRRILFAVLGVVLLVTAWLEAFFVRHEVLLGLVLIAAALLVAALALRVPRLHRSRPVALVLAGLMVLAQVVWFVTRWYPAWVIAQVAAIVLALVCLFLVWHLRRRPIAGVRLAVRGVLGAIGALAVIAAVLVSAVVVVTSFSSSPIAGVVAGSAGFTNSFTSTAKSTRKIVKGNTLLINDVRYGTKYPNSYLDIYIADNDASVERPTLIYIHGGGWIIGSKSSGDPNAGGNSLALGQGPVIAAGYNVVTLDYALAPGAEYPTPIVQTSEAVTFLKQHAKQYGLDMDRVIIGGGSAGGNIAGQFAAIQTDPAYAAEMGIKAVLPASQLKAVLLDSAAIDPSRAGRTQAPDAFNDWEFSISARTYWGVAGFMNDPNRTVQQANLITHMTARFPPTFIADGNYGTFPDQARDLSSRMQALGVTHELNLYPQSAAKLGHGYMALGDSKFVRDYTAKKLAFLQQNVK